MLKLIDTLDIKAETVSLTDTERVTLREANDRIIKLGAMKRRSEERRVGKECLL